MKYTAIILLLLTGCASVPEVAEKGCIYTYAGEPGAKCAGENVCMAIERLETFTRLTVFTVEDRCVLEIKLVPAGKAKKRTKVNFQY